MALAKRNLFDTCTTEVTATEVGIDSARRAETEAFIRMVFSRHYGADVTGFAPELMRLEQAGRTVAAAGWRAAGSGPLFLERYLDQPIEAAITRLAGQPVRRERIVEVANLAADKPGSSLQVILKLGALLDRRGHEWVVFTATRQLVGIFTRLGLPPLALAPADPARLGDEAGAWGRYYETAPVVVAGRIRLGLERSGRRA